jgi:SAM-dependent methyltransferase
MMKVPFKSRLKTRLKQIAHPAMRRFRPAPKLLSQPLSRRYGMERGTPVDRYYIDRFLESHRGDITGDVLEIKSNEYTNRFGHHLGKRDVLDIDASNPDANVITDLAAADTIPSNSYDCFVLTETLHYIYDFQEAIAHAHRILKPGGVLLFTVPCISPIDKELESTEFWRFTRNSCQRLFGDTFGERQVQVETYGNFASCTAWLAGMALEELDLESLNERSPVYVQGVVARAQKEIASFE